LDLDLISNFTVKNLFYKVIRYVYDLESRIAFYPTLFSLGGILFALLMFYCESKGISGYLVENAPILVVNDTETARSLLTTFIGGLISIMVFSFSMVMILLNQASSNFSPRVLPGLISNKRHQVILGIYNASLFYSIFTLVSIEPNGNKYQLPGFSVLLAILFMSLCLGAFIYFIHSISQEIQINNIMSRIFSTAKFRIECLIENEKSSKTKFPNTSDWNVLKATKSGYIQDVSIKSIVQIAKDENLKFKIIPVKGVYSFYRATLIKSSGKLTRGIEEKLLASFHYSKRELIEDNYLLAFKQLTEIAIKAMSPGINDPGTALNALDYLTELFLIRIQKNDKIYYFDDNEIPIVLDSTVEFKTLLYNVMTPLRTYCKADAIVVAKLLQMMRYLLENDTNNNVSYSQAIKDEINSLYEDAVASIINSTDVSLLETEYKRIKDTLF